LRFAAPHPQTNEKHRNSSYQSHVIPLLPLIAATSRD
jgi:hypothetical protein